MTSPPKRELTDSCYHAEHGICPALHLEKPEERCPCFCHEHGGKGFPAPAPASGELDSVKLANAIRSASDCTNLHGPTGIPKPTAEPDAVERACGFCKALKQPCPQARIDKFKKPYLTAADGKTPTTQPFTLGLVDAIIDEAGHALYAAGRAEALKSLREIYARGRVTFRSDGTLSSLDAQEREFEAALDESGDYINKPEFIKEKQNDKSNDPRPGPVPKRDDEYR